MAVLQNNVLLHGISGMLGGSILFKNMNGKTIVARRPALPSRQSEQQRVNRGKFREASAWAKATLLDAEKKAYYQRKAKKMKLPNAYTAAITDYMRKPDVVVVRNADQGATLFVSKKNFTLKRVEAIVGAKAPRAAVYEQNEWTIDLGNDEMQQYVQMMITDDAGNVHLVTPCIRWVCE